MNEEIPQLPQFSYDDAWHVGTTLVEQCRANNFPVTIGIWLGDQLVFHAARPGTSADNDAWLARKARIVRRFRTSSLGVAQSYVNPESDRGIEAFLTAFGLPAEKYFPAGGAVPIFVHDHLVGVLGVSGLTSEQDHELAVDALRGAVTSPTR